MFMVIGKLLYLKGHASRAVQAVALIEPARRASSVALHTTTIRNEHAYYCCGAQCLAANAAASDVVACATSLSPDDSGRIFVCGDSHTLPTAWQVRVFVVPRAVVHLILCFLDQRIAVGTETLLLEPALVTGLKHWHLRPESTFYPKVRAPSTHRPCTLKFISIVSASKLIDQFREGRQWHSVRLHGDLYLRRD